MLPTTGSDRKKQRWWSPHLLPACTLCAGFMLGALVSSSGGIPGLGGTSSQLSWASTEPQRRIVVFYHVYVANNWQARPSYRVPLVPT